MATKLKPCPFCGSKKISVVMPSGDSAFNVACDDCGCVLFTNYKKGKQAVAEWNTRADLRSCGKWILHIDEAINAWECSLCHEVYQLMDGTPEENNMNYCNNCGARMSTEDKR